MFKKFISSLLLTGLITACATSPTGRRQFIAMPDAQVDQMGLQAFDNLKRQTPLSNNGRYIQVARCIASAITRETGGNWEVVVFEDESPNAFALPGYKIGVHTGMIALVDNQDQLAAVIGHEVGHVLARHSNERASQEMALQQGMSMVQAVSNPQTQMGQTALGLLGLGAQYGILMPYSRSHESEADIIGVDLMAKAGFDPRQSIGLWQKMDRAGSGQPIEFMSTHRPTPRASSNCNSICRKPWAYTNKRNTKANAQPVTKDLRCADAPTRMLNPQWCAMRTRPEKK